MKKYIVRWAKITFFICLLISDFLFFEILLCEDKWLFAFLMLYLMSSAVLFSICSWCDFGTPFFWKRGLGE